MQWEPLLKQRSALKPRGRLWLRKDERQGWRTGPRWGMFTTCPVAGKCLIYHICQLP